MDLMTLLGPDDQQTTPPLTDAQTEDADSLLHNSPLNTASDQSSASAHECFSQEKSTSSDSLESRARPPGSPRDNGVLPLLPSLSQTLFPPQSETSSQWHVENEPPLSLPDMRLNTTPESPGAFASEGLMDGFSCENNQAASLLRALTPPSDTLENHKVAAAPPSELYIFESDTKDFILSPDEIKCPGSRPLPPTEGRDSNYESDKRVLMCDSNDIVAGCHHSSRGECDVEIDESGLKPPAASDASEERSMPGKDGREGEVEVAGLTSRPQRTDSPAELWQDACQYLDGEEGTEVWDKMGCCVTQRRSSAASSGSSFLQGETLVSDCNPGGSEGIGWPGDDTGGWGPRVERWSSVDSWASALSDWTGIIEAQPEDFTAAFAEIGAEIDALTQALAEVNTRVDDPETTERPAMGVQDQALKEQSIPERSIHSSLSCVSLSLDPLGPEHLDRDGAQSVESLSDSAQEERDQEDPQSSAYLTSQDSSMGSSSATVGPPGGYGGDATLMPGFTSYADLDVAQFDCYGRSLGSDSLISDGDPVILNITEETDSDSHSEFLTEKTVEDRLCEVTDESRTPQSDWSGGPVESHRPDFLATWCPTGPHVPGVNRQPGQHINVYTHSPFDTSPDLDGARQVGPEWGGPKFIMPLAPLSSVSSLARRTSSGLDGDQTLPRRHLDDNGVLKWDRDVSPASDGVTDETSPESEAQLIHKKELKAKTAERSSPEGRPEAGDAAQSSHAATFKEVKDFHQQHGPLTAGPESQIFISKKNTVACITLNLSDPLDSTRALIPISIAAQTQNRHTAVNMPHKTHKSSSESKTRSKKDKPAPAALHHHGAQAPKKQDAVIHHASAQQACKKQESLPSVGESHAGEKTAAASEAKEANLVIDACVATEKVSSKTHGKKKKKHGGQTGASGGSLDQSLIQVENAAKPKTAKGRIDMFEAKLGAKAPKDTDQPDGAEKKPQKAEVKVLPGEPKPTNHTAHKDHQAKNVCGPLNDDVIKRRRLSEDKFGKIVTALESKFPHVSIKPNGEEVKAEVGANRRKAYSEVVKQKLPPKEDLKVVQPIQAVSLSGDPQSLCLWCQFAAVFSDYTVTWSREAAVLAHIKRSAGDESRVSLTINNASHKDLGKYQCELSGLHGSVTLEYVLTYEVLSEIVIPPSPKIISIAPVELASEEEDVHYSKLMFNEDFLTGQYFGENKTISIVTEKSHFGEGMHRRAFRAKLRGGQIPLLVPGHPCVLKVHNSISYGTKNNEELIQKNFTLAVEECHVQNTARQYIKAYTAAAQAIEAFGDVPEIIPIYLIHRQSNNIPYATLEEELIGDFVKYSVKDGKEINLMRRDSEAGQKCCAFQHWVYHNTEGNLLVTDMQGVGMRLTDVGIATCKKGYKGFKGNCATSFIDQFKALHQCNTYCELLALKSLQPKPKKPSSAPKPKAQPPAAVKKKTFGPTVKSKS